MGSGPPLSLARAGCPVLGLWDARWFHWRLILPVKNPHTQTAKMQTSSRIQSDNVQVVIVLAPFASDPVPGTTVHSGRYSAS